MQKRFRAAKRFSGDGEGRGVVTQPGTSAGDCPAAVRFCGRRDFFPKSGPPTRCVGREHDRLATMLSGPKAVLGCGVSAMGGSPMRPNGMDLGGLWGEVSSSEGSGTHGLGSTFYRTLPPGTLAMDGVRPAVPVAQNISLQCSHEAVSNNRRKSIFNWPAGLSIGVNRAGLGP